MQGYSSKEIDSIVGLLKIASRKRKVSAISPNEKTRKNILQRKVLRSIFHLTNFPSTEVRNELSLLLGINPRSVQVWFQNKRQKYKKLEIYNNSKNYVFCNSVCKKIFPKGHETEEVELDTYILIGIIGECLLEVYGTSVFNIK